MMSTSFKEVWKLLVTFHLIVDMLHRQRVEFVYKHFASKARILWEFLMQKVLESRTRGWKNEGLPSGPWASQMQILHWMSFTVVALLVEELVVLQMGF